MGDLQLSFLNRRSYHHQCLRPWGIGCKVCGCLHLSFTSLNTKSKNWPVAHLLWRNAFFSFLKQICALHFLPGELMSKQPPILRYHFIPGWTYFGGLDSWCVYSWPWPQFLWTCLVPALNETTKHHIEYRKAIVSGLDSPCCETWRGMAWSTLLQLGIHVCPSKFNLLSDMFHWWRWCTYSWITFSHTRSRGTTHRGWWCVEGGNWTLYIRNWSNCTFPLNLPWMYVLRMWGNSKYESVRRSNRIARRICYLQVTQMLFATDFVHIMRLSW